MVSVRCAVLAAWVLWLFASRASAADYKLELTDTSPEGLPAAIADAVVDNGLRVSGATGPLCELWLAKSVPRKPGFSPTLSLKYPLVSGQFLGVLQVHKGPKFTDFRGQVLVPGLYTLRYGQQPQDGNHVGTSDYSDFLLALRIRDEKSTANLDDAGDLHGLSADAAGTAHPAIFQLLPPDAAPPSDQARLDHDDDHDFWILQLSAGDKPLTLRMVIVGTASE